MMCCMGMTHVTQVMMRHMVMPRMVLASMGGLRSGWADAHARWGKVGAVGIKHGSSSSRLAQGASV